MKKRPKTQEPTCRQLFDAELAKESDFVLVKQHSEANWKHGTYEERIFKRKSDGTFWCAVFRLSTDGETNELRDGRANIYLMKKP